MKSFFISLYILSIFFATKASAADLTYEPLEPISGFIDTKITINPAGLTKYLDDMFRFGIALAGLFAVVMIIWGGFQYTLSDVVFSKDEGRKKITQALQGLLLALLSWLILYTINPQLLSTKLEVKDIKFNPQSTTVAGGTQPGATTGGVSAIPGGATADQGSSGNARLRYYSSTETGSDSNTQAGNNAYGGQLIANDDYNPNIVGSSASSYYPGGTIWARKNSKGETVYYVVDDNNIDSRTGKPVNDALSGPMSFDVYTKKSDTNNAGPDYTDATIVYTPSKKLSASEINALRDINKVKEVLGQQ